MGFLHLVYPHCVCACPPIFQSKSSFACTNGFLEVKPFIWTTTVEDFLLEDRRYRLSFGRLSLQTFHVLLNRSSARFSPTSTLRNAGAKVKTSSFLRAFTPMRSRVASQSSTETPPTATSLSAATNSATNNRKNSNTLSPSSARTSLQAQVRTNKNE